MSDIGSDTDVSVGTSSFSLFSPETLITVSPPEPPYASIASLPGSSLTVTTNQPHIFTILSGCIPGIEASHDSVARIGDIDKITYVSRQPKWEVILTRQPGEDFRVLRSDGLSPAEIADLLANETDRLCGEDTNPLMGFAIIGYLSILKGALLRSMIVEIKNG